MASRLTNQLTRLGRELTRIRGFCIRFRVAGGLDGLGGSEGSLE